MLILAQLPAEELMAELLLIPADAAAVVADELASNRLVFVAETPTVCWWSGGEPDKLLSPMLPLRLLIAPDPHEKLSCCKFPKGNPIPLTPDVAATIDFFLPGAPKLKNLHRTFCCFIINYLGVRLAQAFNGITIQNWCSPRIKTLLPHQSHEKWWWLY